MERHLPATQKSVVSPQRAFESRTLRHFTESAAGLAGKRSRKSWCPSGQGFDSSTLRHLSSQALVTGTGYGLVFYTSTCEFESRRGHHSRVV